MIAGAFLFVVAAAGGPANLCNLCHPDVRVEFERSVHSSEEITCVSCHGGDLSASTADTAHRGDYRGRIRRRDVPDVCAECHSNTKWMSPYNLPTDQHALYQTSQHGRALAKGDENVAVCTDCHGVHEIFGVDDPRNAVYPTNVPETCAVCHSDRVLMSSYGITGDPYEDFIASRHGEALLERQNASAPECSRCHGAHGAAPPGVGDIEKVCGKCHAMARAHFLDSPHKLAMDEAGLPECASCHDHHRILRADVGMLATLCFSCHEPDTEPMNVALQMKTLFTSASDDLQSARSLVDRAAGIPLYVEDYRARLEVANTSLIESLTAMHSVDLGVVEQLTGLARSIGHEVESEVRGKLEGRKWRRVGLLVFWFYLLVTVAALIRLRKRAAQQVER